MIIWYLEHPYAFWFFVFKDFEQVINPYITSAHTGQCIRKGTEYWLPTSHETNCFCHKFKGRYPTPRFPLYCITEHLLTSSWLDFSKPQAPHTNRAHCIELFLVCSRGKRQGLTGVDEPFKDVRSPLKNVFWNSKTTPRARFNSKLLCAEGKRQFWGQHGVCHSGGL